MRILVAGGSGLIGAHVTEVLRERGHDVTTLARTGRPGVDHVLDLGSAPVDALLPVLSGHDGVVLAARTDEQSPQRRPALPAVRLSVVEPAVRLFTAARAAGLTRGVVVGSYYTHLDRLHPQWRLPERHVYIRCRVEQAERARAASGPDLPVAVLELPFVVGRAGDRLPNWAGPLGRWARSPLPLLAPAGGTAVASARTVAEVAAAALERASGDDIPVADANLTWRELFAGIAAATGGGRRVGRLPSGVVRAGLRLVGAVQAAGGRESGLDPTHLAGLLLAPLFIEPVTGRSLDAAFHDAFAARAPASRRPRPGT